MDIRNLILYEKLGILIPEDTKNEVILFNIEDIIIPLGVKAYNYIHNENKNIYFEEDLMIKFKNFCKNTDSNFQKVSYEYFKNNFNLKLDQIFCHKIRNEENIYEVIYNIKIKHFPDMKRIVIIKNPELIEKKTYVCGIEYSSNENSLKAILVIEYKFKKGKYEFTYTEKIKKRFRTSIKRFNYESNYIKICDDENKFILINKNGIYIGEINKEKIKEFKKCIKENKIDENKLEKITNYDVIHTSFFRNKLDQDEINVAINYYNYKNEIEANYFWYEYYSEELIRDIDRVKENIKE